MRPPGGAAHSVCAPPQPNPGLPGFGHLRFAGSGQARSRLGRGWGWGSESVDAFRATTTTPLPTPPPQGGREHTECGEGALSLLQQSCTSASRIADKLDHRRLVGARSDANSGGTDGKKRVRDLDGETEMHRLERAHAHASARGAIEISLGAAGGEMRHAVERARRGRRGKGGRKALAFEGAKGNEVHRRYAPIRGITGAILAGKIEQRMLAPARAQEFCEIVIVAVGRSDLAKTRGTRRVGGVAAHRKGWEPTERRGAGVGGQRG